ncbi:MAG: hypothetical protein AAF614_11530 [Chloroflexota bacterium]
MTTVNSPDKKTRLDVAVVWGGVAFSFFFTFLMWVAGQRFADIPHPPEPSEIWYEWKLVEPTFWGGVTAWGFYILHQLIIWYLIYYAQTRVKKYTTGLHKVNIAALAVTAFFIVLHFVQTQIWYDGLAQHFDTGTSAQYSVILLLVWVLLMENSRRGLFFGKKLPFPKHVNRFARKYHGYVFAWATIYTFWFHPMEITGGHLFGFFYMFLLLLQGSLFFTRVHTNRWWMFVQEALVLLHAVMVAVTQSPAAVRMFGFGFALILVVTQLYGLGLGKWVKGAVTAVFVVSVIWVYSQAGWGNVNEVFRIPVIEYLMVVVLGLIFFAGQWIYQRLKPEPAV